MKFSDFLDKLGVSLQDPDIIHLIDVLFNLVFISLVTFFLFMFVRKHLSTWIWKVEGRFRNKWDDIILETRLFNKLSYLILPLGAFIILELNNWEDIRILMSIVNIWTVVTVLYILNALLNTINKIYESYPISKDRPITVFIQIIKVLFYTIAIILIISVLLDKEVGSLLVGLGAFAAVLLLIFKDSILGFVAGIQLIANDMVRIGDWIVMSNHNANGEVQEINLYTVKVRNWDKTVSTIPTYLMVSESFINWRGMFESGGRRIMRSINIDVSTVHFLSKEEIEALKNSEYLKDYITIMLERLKEQNKDKRTVLDEHNLTNLGVFRHYLDMWLEANPNINKEMIFMVRQLQPTPTGIPLEIYCFSARQRWVDYERVQADIFDHVLAVISHFNLKVYQYPTDLFMPIKENK